MVTRPALPVTRDPAAALQIAIVDRLMADPGLIAYFGGPPRVFDIVPMGPNGITAQFPYISIGTVQVIQDERECAKSSTTHFDLQYWARGSGAGVQVKVLAGLGREAMQKDLDLTAYGHTVVIQGFEHSVSKKEPDGISQSVTQTHLFETDPLT